LVCAKTIHNFNLGGSMSFLQPSNFTAGGGLLDDVDALFKKVRVTNWDYNGSVPVPVPALEVTMEVDGMDGDHVQYFSLGKNTDWQPSEDGMEIVAVGKATGISSSSNAAILIGSIVNSGFPENKITDNVTCFEGLKAHLSRIPAPKRNVTKAPRADGKVYEDTVLTVTAILQYPWDKKAGKTAAGKPATAPAAGKPATTGKPATAPAAGKAPAAAAAAPPSEEFDARCTEVVQGVLAENPEGVDRKKLPGLVFNAVAKDDADRNRIVTRVFQEDFLSAGPWTYENGRVSM
jgi:hypothetical protein